MSQFRKSFDALSFWQISHRYKLINSIISLGMDKQWRRRAIRELDLHSGDRLLDIGCGSGDLLNLTKRDSIIRIGLDPARQFLPNSKDSIRTRAKGKSLFICGIAESLPIESECIEKCTSAFALRNFVSRESGLKELFRVSHQGGKMTILEFSPPKNLLLKLMVGIYMRLAVPLIGGLISGNLSAYSYLGRTVMSFPQPEKIAVELKSTGFTNVSWQRLSGGLTVLYRFTKT